MRQRINHEDEELKMVRLRKEQRELEKKGVIVEPYEAIEITEEPVFLKPIEIKIEIKKKEIKKSKVGRPRKGVKK